MEANESEVEPFADVAESLGRIARRSTPLSRRERDGVMGDLYERSLSI